MKMKMKMLMMVKKISSSSSSSHFLSRAIRQIPYVHSHHTHSTLFLLLLFFKSLAVLGLHCGRQALCGGARASHCGAWTVLLQPKGFSGCGHGL